MLELKVLCTIALSKCSEVLIEYRTDHIKTMKDKTGGQLLVDRIRFSHVSATLTSTKAPFKYDFFKASEPKNHKPHALNLNGA